MQVKNENKNEIKEDSKKKERHIVTWTQEEDDILRRQISVHGTENWTIIAANFKDKSTRQCRRRWYTYLNSDVKKGGWSPEEDMLLCEAQKLYGNKWTEIAKVVSGRTDNAVKNRFTTLCKKRAKYEAMAKENINRNNKRTLIKTGFNTDVTGSLKKLRRSHIPDLSEVNYGDRAHKKCGTVTNQPLRHPLAVLTPNVHNVKSLAAQHHANIVKEVHCDDRNSRIEGTFLKKDDLKVAASMQQAEIFSSLAQKVNAENTELSLENAWKVLQDFLSQSKENDILQCGIPDIDFQFEDFKDLMEDLRSSNDETSQYWRQPDLYESPASSEYSTGSTIVPHPAGDRNDECVVELAAMLELVEAASHSTNVEERNCEGEKEKGMLSRENTNQVDIVSMCIGKKDIDGVLSSSFSAEYNSPLQVTPLFRSLAAGIPSPTFSESERNFLLKTLGIESPSPYQTANPSQPPPCKRVLLNSL